MGFEWSHSQIIKVTAISQEPWVRQAAFMVILLTSSRSVSGPTSELHVHMIRSNVAPMIKFLKFLNPIRLLRDVITCSDLHDVFGTKYELLPSMKL